MGCTVPRRGHAASSLDTGVGSKPRQYSLGLSLLQMSATVLTSAGNRDRERPAHGAIALHRPVRQNTCSPDSPWRRRAPPDTRIAGRPFTVRSLRGQSDTALSAPWPATHGPPALRAPTSRCVAAENKPPGLPAGGGTAPRRAGKRSSAHIPSRAVGRVLRRSVMRAHMTPWPARSAPADPSTVGRWALVTPAGGLVERSADRLGDRARVQDDGPIRCAAAPLGVTGAAGLLAPDANGEGGV